MDPIVRTALAATIQEEDLTSELQQIEAEIAQAEAALKSSLEKEKFLGLRSRQYRKALDARAHQLKQERASAAAAAGDDDEEEQALADWEARMEKWEKDEDALQSVIETHKKIVANCEQMRRDIKELHKKKARITNLNEQCQDFVEYADSNKDPDRLELSPLMDEETQLQDEAIGEERDVEAGKETESLIIADDGGESDIAESNLPEEKDALNENIDDVEESRIPTTQEKSLETEPTKG